VTETPVPELTAHVLGGPACTLGEGPVWDQDSGTLAWVDILGHRLHTAPLDDDGQLGPVTSIAVPDDIGAAIPVAEPTGGWLLSMGIGLHHLDPAGTITELIKLEPGQAGVLRMNDAKCDPTGRWWGGSMSYDESQRRGTLFRVDLDGSVHAVLGGVGVSNGLGWTADQKTMFFNDSGIETFSVFDYDARSGTPTDRRVLTDGSDGYVPDGMCVDDEDTVWSVWWDHGAIRRYDRAGRLLQTVRVPVRRTSSCAFAGRNRDLLVITTGRVDDNDHPDAGRLFVVRPGVSGPTAVRFGGALPAGRTIERTVSG
jgi:sugar lactone lactonase YvrE